MSTLKGDKRTESNLGGHLLSNALLTKHGRRRRFHQYPRDSVFAANPSPPQPGYAHRPRRSETQVIIDGKHWQGDAFCLCLSLNTALAWSHICQRVVKE